jgi:hypothetical protein
MLSHVLQRSRQAAVASALVLALGSAAYAAGPGPGAGGPGGPGPRGAHVEQVIAQLKTQLNLNTSQQVAFDNAVAASRAARETGRAEHEKIRGAMQAELATPAPDLARVAAIADQVQATMQAQRTAVRNQWLSLYATFSAEQKLVVRDALLKRAERMEQFRDRMHSRMGG